MTHTKRRKWAGRRGNRLTAGNGGLSRGKPPFTDDGGTDDDRALERLAPGVMRGDVGAIIEFLERFGKDRGYGKD